MINKRSKTAVTPTPAKKATSAAKKITGTDTSGITSVSIGRSFTIPGKGEYESQKVSVIVTAPTFEEASAAVGEFMVTEFERSSEQFAAFIAASDDLAEEVGTDTSEEEEEEEAEEGEEEEEEEEAEEEEVDEDTINAMKRPALIKFVAEQELDLEPTDFASTAKGLAKFRAAVIEALTVEEAEEEEEEEAEEEEEVEIDADAINAMERSELVALIKDNDLEVTPKEHKSLKALRNAVIEAVEGGEEEEGEEEEEEEAEEEEEEEEGYKRSELEKMKVKDLQAIYKGWPIKDKIPTGSDAIIRKKMINRIMQFQDTGK